jgi:hypothetical protein
MIADHGDIGITPTGAQFVDVGQKWEREALSGAEPTDADRGAAGRRRRSRYDSHVR